MENIDTMINEIKSLIVKVENKEKELELLNTINTNNTVIYKNMLENIINEYHQVCKKMYN